MNTAPTSTDEAARREYRSLRRLVLAALVLSAAVALSLNLADPDLWGHVRYGQDVLTDGQLPRTATYTYTAEDYRWVNHENLAELAMAALYDLVGASGMLVVKCLWGMGILGLMVVVNRRRGVPLLTLWAFLLLVANNLTAFFPVRPQLLSFMCLALLVTLLDHVFFDWHRWLKDAAAEPARPRLPGRRLAWLALAPATIVLWTNSHGAFVAGVAILSVYLAGRALEALVYLRGRAWPLVGALTLCGALSIAATLVNPYGTGLLEWLLLSLGSPRPEITEWAATRPSDPTFWPFVALVAVASASLTFSRIRRDWVHVAILALVAWQAAMHLRHIAFLALLCGFWLPAHVQSAIERLRPEQSSLAPVRFGRPWRWGTALALAVILGLQTCGLYFRVRQLPVFRYMYPVDAVQFIAEHDLRGKLVVSFNWAQYAIAALAPDVRVSFDGRFRTCYPQEIVDMNFDFQLGEHKGRRYRSPRSGPLDPTRVLEYGQPDLVLVDRKYQHAAQVMAEEAKRPDPQWTLLYQDGVAQLWGRREKFDDPRSASYVSPDERVIGERVHRDYVAWPALPDRSRRQFARGDSRPDRAEL